MTDEERNQKTPLPWEDVVFNIPLSAASQSSSIQKYCKSRENQNLKNENVKGRVYSMHILTYILQLYKESLFLLNIFIREEHFFQCIWEANSLFD